MPSQRFDKIILATLIIVFAIIILFYDVLAAYMLRFYPTIGDRIVQGFGGAVFTGAAHRLYKILLNTSDLRTSLFQRDIMDGISDVKRNVGEVDCKVSVMGCRLERVEQTIDKMSIYSDAKKRRWAEYDADWVAVRGNFEKLHNNDVYALGRIIKDGIREFAHEVMLSDLSQSNKNIVDFMEERGRAYTEDIFHRAKQILPPQFIDYFRAENGDSRETFRAGVKELLELDKVNNRAEKIHLLARQFMGRTHNTLYLSWSRWSEAHRDQLASDPVEKYFKAGIRHTTVPPEVKTQGA